MPSSPAGYPATEQSVSPLAHHLFAAMVLVGALFRLVTGVRPGPWSQFGHERSRRPDRTLAFRESATTRQALA